MKISKENFIYTCIPLIKCKVPYFIDEIKPLVKLIRMIRVVLKKNENIAQNFNFHKIFQVKSGPRCAASRLQQHSGTER
jgi:hypothetical protein